MEKLTRYNINNLIKNVGIYLIKNEVTGKIYIGSSLNLKQRLGMYILRNYTINKEVLESLTKFGVENHTFTILEFFDDISKKDLLIKEDEYLFKFVEKDETRILNTRSNDWSYIKNREEYKNHYKPINMFKKETGDFVKSFDTINDCVKYLGLDNNGNISLCLTGKRISAYGFTYQYSN